MHRLVVLVLFLANVVAAQEKPISLYNGPAPGSETWNWDEKTIDVGNMKIALDVSKPTLIPFLPAKPNGTAVIIAPGGAFHALAVGHEGADVAKWLNEKGVTAFVLKYRLSHDDPAHPENNFVKLLESKNFKKLDSINAVIVPLAMQDGLTAMKYVREHAASYNIDPDRIGFMGFSAGGTVTMSVIYNATDKDRPNFVAPIYAYEGAIIGSAVPTVKTPIFIAAATDDDLGLASHSVHIYEKWVGAKQPAELHMYERGKHGFGMHKQNLPVDKWIERFGDWLEMQGLLKE
jgi:acetyl esterase/lipase